MQEIVISGGGMTGLLMALAFSPRASKTPLPVSVFEAGDYSERLDPKRDTKALAITASSKLFLSTLGVWEMLAKDACPVQEMRIVDQSSSRSAPLRDLVTFEKTHHEGAPFRPVAWIIEAHNLYAALYAAAQQAPTIRLIPHARVTAYEANPGHANLRIEKTETGLEESLQTPLLIIAEGRHSALRDRYALPPLRWDYGQRAIVATVQHTVPHHHTAFQNFKPQGPLALLPLLDSCSSLVWTEQDERAQTLMALSDEDFCRELESALGGSLGSLSLKTPRSSWPLSFSFSEQWVLPRFALIGDAAHGIHPLAGLGLNLGMKDCAALVEVCVDAARLGLDFGTLSVLTAYARWRRFDTLATGLAMEGFHHFFKTENPFLAELRRFGSRIIDQSSVLKTFAIEEASGKLGSLPKLMKGERL